jgi:hypothetical protein
MAKKSIRKALKNKRRAKRSRKMRGGTNFPTVDNVIPYNENIGMHGDPIDPINLISSRNIVGGKKRRLSKKFMKQMKMEMKELEMKEREKLMKTPIKGGSIFNYDLLTGASFQDNAVQSLNTSSGTQNTLDKIVGNPQETGPTLSYNRLPDSALI